MPPKPKKITLTIPAEEWNPIRTSLTYCLPSGITDSEWEKIVNKVQMLIDEGYKKALDDLRNVVENDDDARDTLEEIISELKQ